MYDLAGGPDTAREDDDVAIPWFTAWRRRRILTRPESPQWGAWLADTVPGWGGLSDEQRTTLRRNVKVFVT